MPLERISSIACNKQKHLITNPWTITLSSNAGDDITGDKDISDDIRNTPPLMLMSSIIPSLILLQNHDLHLFSQLHPSHRSHIQSNNHL